MRFGFALGLLLMTASAQAQDQLRVRDYAPLLAAGALDITSTAISQGREQNPTIRWIRHEPTMLMVGAAMEIGAFTLAARTVGKNRPKLMRVAMWTAAAIHVFAATNNLQQRRVMRYTLQM